MGSSLEPEGAKATWNLANMRCLEQKKLTELWSGLKTSISEPVDSDEVCSTRLGLWTVGYLVRSDKPLPIYNL